MTPPQVAELVHLPENTLKAWRAARKGPRYMRVGKHVRYLRVDVERWLEQQAIGGG